uniref:Uncharacterized protein n=1 Tax=Anguilla anguilla TaxID=7936 RepID=A0A0E9SJ53_ANGAN
MSLQKFCSLFIVTA